jgi:polar amino acid transport system permease protein
VPDYDWNWQIIWQYRAVLPEALLMAIGLAVVPIASGLAFGLALAYLSLARQPLVRAPAIGVGRLVRSTPLLLLVFLVYLVLPQWGVRLFDAQGSFMLALSIVAAAYMAENFRAALAAIPRLYLDAAKAIGLTGWRRQLHVVLPIAVRHAFPSLANSIVSVFKDTSIASIIAVPELTYVAKEISTDYFRVFEAWTTISIIYLATTALIAGGLRAIERRLPGAGA